MNISTNSIIDIDMYIDYDIIKIFKSSQIFSTDRRLNKILYVDHFCECYTIH